MKRECKLDFVPPDAIFEDLDSLLNWHQQYVVIYQRKIGRIEESARVATNAKFPRLKTYQRKLAMHQSAVKVILDSFRFRKAA